MIVLNPPLSRRVLSYHFGTDSDLVILFQILEDKFEHRLRAAKKLPYLVVFKHKNRFEVLISLIF